MKHLQCHGLSDEVMTQKLLGSENKQHTKDRLLVK